MRGAFLVGLVFFLLPVHVPARAQDPPAATTREPVLVTISKETTRITEPLKPSGYPDFLEAANIAARGKVSPATNGAVLLVRAAGAYGVSPGKQQEEFYERLGIDPLPENTPRHVFHYDFVQQLKEAELPPLTEEEKKLEYDNEQLDSRRARVEREFEHCGDHPWTAKEYPLVARWLQEQEQSFAQLDRLREYADAYMPQLTGEKDGSMIASTIPFFQIVRHLALDLKIRAMYSLGEGKTDEAIDDLERLFMLSGYLQKNRNMIAQLVGFAIHGLMHSLVNELVLSAKLDSPQLGRVQKMIEKHYPDNMSLIAESLDQGERHVMLETICRFAEFGPGGDEQKPLPLKTRKNLDYDLMLKLAHEHYDRLVDMTRIEDPVRQAEAFVQLDKELSELSKNGKNPGTAIMAFLSKEKRSRAIMDILKALLTPALNAARMAGTKNAMRRELWTLSIALEQYRRQRGQFPESLDELAPQFLAKVPLDRNTGKPLIYQTNGKGVLVYSVGRDLEDHQGFEGEVSENMDSDDIAIFTNDHRPKPPQPKPARDFFE